MIPGDEMQMDKDQGQVKLTNQRLIFAGTINTSEWAFAKLLSAARDNAGNDFIFGVSNRKKTSGLRFSAEDGPTFSRLFAMALYAYENGVPATITAITDELATSDENKPALVLASGKAKAIEG